MPFDSDVFLVFIVFDIFAACPSGCLECYLQDDGSTVICDLCADEYVASSTGLCVGMLDYNIGTLSVHANIMNNFLNCSIEPQQDEPPTCSHFTTRHFYVENMSLNILFTDLFHVVFESEGLQPFCLIDIAL